MDFAVKKRIPALAGSVKAGKFFIGRYFGKLISMERSLSCREAT
jgi:hypothetical protein